jgi:hypothetical protein
MKEWKFELDIRQAKTKKTKITLERRLDPQGVDFYF